MTTLTPDTEAPVMEPIIKASDRCDRCGAQAFVVTDHNGTPLLWCAHHFREHKHKLAEFVVVDETDKLNIKPSISATT